MQKTATKMKDRAKPISSRIQLDVVLHAKLTLLKMNRNLRGESVTLHDIIIELLEKGVKDVKLPDYQSPKINTQSTLW